jgi:hypothetical protein
MGGLPQAQYSVHSSANPSASGIKYDPLRYGLKPGKYRVKQFGHSTQWRTREAMACVGELLRSRRSESQCAIGSRIGSRLHRFLLVTSEEACGVPRSQELRDTTGPIFQISKQSGRLTTSWDDPKTTRVTVSPTFHTHTGERLRNSRTPSSQEPGRSIVIDFQMI